MRRAWCWEILSAEGEGGDMLDSITDSMDTHLSKLWDTVEYRGAWYAAVHGVTKNRTQFSSWTTTVTMSFIGFFNSFIEIQFTYHKIHLLQCIIQLFFLIFHSIVQYFFFPPFTGEKPDPDQTFKLTSLQNFSSCLPNSCTTLVSNHSLSHRQPETVLTETPQDTIVSVLYTSVKNIVKMKNSDLS